MDSDQVVSELRRALLEIEWVSRRSSTKATLRTINELSRAALRTRPEQLSADSSRPLLSRVS